MSEQEIKVPKWLRLFYIVSGSLSVIYAIIVLINIKFDFLITAILFGIALVTIGVTRILVGVFDKQQSKSISILNIIVGIILIPIGIFTIVKHDITMRIVFVFIAVAFLLLGIIGVAKGFQEKAKESMSRLLIIIYGFLLILVGILNMAIDNISKITLIAILSCGFIVLGIRRLIDGILGEVKAKKIDKVNELQQN
ncbi:MAG TPA: DUF308 domain-containing protein [candidate division Zixibacteria bacterium]|nr:DUF308 domain-containing protein [candidate division Zixibacteria bacterium]